MVLEKERAQSWKRNVGAPFARRHPLALTIVCAVAFAAAAFGATGGAPMNSASEPVAEAGQAGFTPRAGDSVRSDLRFIDDAGRAVRLGDYLSDKPVILVLGYHSCPMLCSMVLDGLTESLLELKSSAGESFEVVHVSIDPDDSTIEASAAKKKYSRRYGRPGAAKGLHFLTGDAAAIQTLAAEVGFGYQRLPGSREYAHPSGLVILSPDGRVSRYLYGVRYPARDLARALEAARTLPTEIVLDSSRDSSVETDAQAGEDESAAVTFLCFRFNPDTGRHSRLVLNAVRTAGLATLGGLGWIIMHMARRERPRRKAANEGGGE